MPQRRAILGWMTGAAFGALGCERASDRDGAIATSSTSASASAPQRPPLRLWLGGDVHVGDDARPLFAPELARRLAGTGIVNLEGPIGASVPTGDPAAPRLFNAPKGTTILRDAGVGVVTIANNHARDLGDDAPRATAAAIRNAGLVASGLAAGDAETTIDGWRVGVVAHDLASDPPTPGALAALRARTDVLVVAFHVTGPPSYLPAQDLRAAVDQAANEGADIIVAHGAHAIGPLERRGRAVIAWGLGNLRFACDCTQEVDGLLLAVTVRPDQHAEARAIPIDAGLRGQSARPSRDPKLMLDLLAAIGSSPFARTDDDATF